MNAPCTQMVRASENGVIFLPERSVCFVNA